MKILFQREIIGEMANTYQEGFWVHGNFIPAQGYFRYQRFFSSIVNEEGMDETEFDTELLDECNWFVESDHIRKGISIPAIYEDGDVSIRFR